jgi:hypothetical protein
VSNYVVTIPNALARIRWRRLPLAILGTTFILAALLLLTSYATVYYAHHKAKKLLGEVRTLEPGKTSVEDVKKLIQRYGGEEFDAHSYSFVEGSDKKYTWPDPCLGEALSYDISANPPWIVMRTVYAFLALQKIGLHPWAVSLNIHHNEGKVSCYSQKVLFWRQDGQEVEVTASLNLRNPQSLVEQGVYEPESFVSRSQYHQTRVEVLRGASAEQKNRAFQMDLSCTVSLGGCYLPCQIMPLGWLDSVRDRQSHGRVLPEGADDSRCPAL